MDGKRRRPGIGAYLAPVAVVAALGALAQVEPEIPVVEVEQPSIELRDRFLGGAARGDLIWLVGKNGKIVRSEDRGRSWQVQDAPRDTNWQDIAVWDAQHAAVVGNDGHGAVTSDGGRTWRMVSLPVSDLSGKVFRVAIDPEGVAWATAEVGVVMYSRDRGASWQRADTPREDVAWNDIAFLGDGGLCVVGEFGRILCRDAAGGRWVAPQSPVEQSLMAVAFRPDGTGLAVGVNGTLVESRDRGQSWRTLSDLTDRHLFDIAWDGDAWVIVGDKGAMLRGSAERGWQVGRVSGTDYAWHTCVVPLEDDTYLITGQTTGLWSGGDWDPFLRRG